MATSERSGRYSRWIVLAPVLFLAACGVAFGLWWYELAAPTGNADDRLIRGERRARLAYAIAGRELPGTPELARLDQRLADHGVALGNAVFIRIFKLEFELELWLERGGRYHRFAIYPICRWSGRLGPKVREGDRQAPEGFYTVDAASLNPRSRWHRSFNLGYPNAFDRAHDRTGSFLMVHGGCSSAGCLAMTDAVIDEIWRIVVAALDKGQRRFHVHVFPFRMDEAMLAARQDDPNMPFWRQLQAGYEAFEQSQLVPAVRVCKGSYQFEAGLAGASGRGPLRAACKAEGRSQTRPPARATVVR